MPAVDTKPKSFSPNTSQAFGFSLNYRLVCKAKIIRIKIKTKHETKITFSSFEKSVISWRALEYIYHEKSALWFIFAGIVVLGLVIYGLLSGGWTFSVAIIVFAGTYYLFYRNAPPIIEVKISKVGVKIGKHLFHTINLKILDSVRCSVCKRFICAQLHVCIRIFLFRLKTWIPQKNQSHSKRGIFRKKKNGSELVCGRACPRI